METKSLVIIVSLAVLISVHSSDGITCWTCSSGATPNCGADFNSTGLTSMQCSGNVSCSIITQNNVITRTCGATKEVEGCNTVQSVETCYCNTDQCTTAPGQGTTAAPGDNAAMIPTLSLLTFGIGVLIKFFF